MKPLELDPAHEEEALSRAGHGEPFSLIMERRLSRRSMLKGAAGATVTVVAFSALGDPGVAEAQQLQLNFEPITPNTLDQIMVSPGHRAQVLLRWGDPILPDGPDFDVNNQTPEAQARQFGYNCDFVGFLPLPLGSQNSQHGFLVVNHEYTNPELMFPGYSEDEPSQQQVDVELMAHGLSIVEIQVDDQGQWWVARNGAQNRRITGMTPMEITGPAAGHPWMRTNADPEGRLVLGTLNNCSAGKSPWGTVVTSEENFQQYFANLNALAADDPRHSQHARYGIAEESSDRKWERYHSRFDLAQEPNEPFRFGWSVELDPYDPTSTPRKHTALGRIKREATTFVVTPSGRVAVYSGDDERFEYIYKFVTAGSYNPDDRQANMRLLEEGTLYVAKFNDDGTGEWLPLVFGQGPLTAENGFTSQGDVVLRTRAAGDLLGATKMDRPEDIEYNPVNGKVYAALTNNTRRGTEGREGATAANPRELNEFGHVIEMSALNDDHAATAFSWEIFLLCGNPSDPSTYFAGFPKEKVSPIANPDNLTYDMAGNLWISTDGQPSSLRHNDGLFAVPVAGSERGYVRQFFSAVPEAEVSGPEFTNDNTSLFVAVQHPGEGGSFEEPISVWPDGHTPPRPSVVVMRADDGGRIGMQPVPAAPEPTAVPLPTATPDVPQPGGLPDTGLDGVPASLPNTSAPVAPGVGVAVLGAAAAAAGAFLRRRDRLMRQSRPEDDQSGQDAGSAPDEKSGA